MTFQQLTGALTASIPIVLFLSVVVALVLFVKYKGTIDALRDAANTYEQVADAYRLQVEQLKSDIECLNAEIRQLKNDIIVQKQATQLVADEVFVYIKQHLAQMDGDR